MKKTKTQYKNIEAERVRNGLTKEEFSKALNISTRTYHNWQKDDGDIPASKLLTMAQMFDCSIDYLLQAK